MIILYIWLGLILAMFIVAFVDIFLEPYHPKKARRVRRRYPPHPWVLLTQHPRGEE